MQQQENSQQCKQCKRLLFDYVSDCTDEKQSVFVRNHLDSCEVCQAEYQEISAMLSILHEDSVPELPKGFQLSLHRKLVDAAEEIKQKKARSFFGVLKNIRTSASWKAVAPALVCFVLVVAAYSGGVFEQWQQAGKPLDFADTPVVQTEETPVPTAQSVVKSDDASTGKTEIPAKKAIATTAPVAEKSVPVVTEEPAVDRSADTTDYSVHTATEAPAPEENHVPMMMSYRRADMPEVGIKYSLTVTGSVTDFLEECRIATALTLESVSEDTENHAILHLSEEQWKIFSQYITTTGQELLCVNPEETGAVVVVEINGYEG